MTKEEKEKLLKEMWEKLGDEDKKQLKKEYISYNNINEIFLNGFLNQLKIQLVSLKFLHTIISLFLK